MAAPEQRRGPGGTSLEEIVTPLRTLWKFDYEPHVRALRDLYEVAKKEQWNAATDVPWEREIDTTAQILDPSQDDLKDLDFVKELPEEKQRELSVRRAAWLLSQFLHGEQGSLLCCGQLVEVVPDIDGKLYAATQVVDEARHVEVFHRYIRRLDRVYPIHPNLQRALNLILEAPSWQMKCVGMQVIVEGVAMGAFKIMKEGTCDPLLRSIVELTAQDEARHVSYGLIYMMHELPGMPDPERERIEDFAFGTIQTLVGPHGLPPGGIAPLSLLREVGVDLERAEREMQQKLSDPAFRAVRPDALRDYVMPLLRRLGIVTERTAGKYADLGFPMEV